MIPSIIGQKIGKGDIKEAKSYLSIIRRSSSILFIGICFYVWIYDKAIIALLTDLNDVKSEAELFSYMIVFNAFP